MTRNKKKVREPEKKGKVIPLMSPKNKHLGMRSSPVKKEPSAGKGTTWWRSGGKTADRASFLPAKGSHTLFLVAFTGLMLLLFYPPYFRGLFFPVEQRWTLLLAIMLFTITYLWKLTYREVSFLNCPLDFAAAALVLVYILAAIKPASQGLAVAEVAKVLLYFLTYWLVSRLGGRSCNNYLLHTLYLAAAGTALAALLTATGLVYIKDGFLGGRFYSTLQYPNALASYVGAGSIIGFYLWARAYHKRPYLYTAANYLLLMVFLGTGSRGAYLFFPLFMVFFCLLAPRGYRIPVIAHSVFCTVAALVGNMGFIPMAVAKSYGSAWGWFALGLLVAFGGQLIIQLTGRSLESPRVRKVAVATVMLLLIGFSFYLAAHVAVKPAVGGEQPGGVLNRILPPQIMARIQDINLDTSSSQHRLFWTGDAIKMVRDRPLLGFGGGGWEAAYRQYQSYFYNSTQVHNHYAQVAVETGMAGISILLAVWLLFLITSWGNYRHNQGEERFQALATGTAALFLGTHAVIDFNLALGAVSIMLWAFFGLSRSLEEERLGSQPILTLQVFKQKRAAYITGLTLSCLLMFLFSISYLMGVASARRAAIALQYNNLEATAAYLEEAGRYDPFTASYHNDLAGIYLNVGQTEKALVHALAASAREPFNISILGRLAEAYWHSDLAEQAVATMERSRRASPWAAGVWENLAQIYTVAGIKYLKDGQQEKAREVFEQAAAMPEEVLAKVDSLGKYKGLHDRGGLALTGAIHLRAAIGQYFLGHRERAAASLQKASADAGVKAEAILWQAVLAYRESNNFQAEQLLTKVRDIDANIAEQYDALKSLSPLDK